MQVFQTLRSAFDSPCLHHDVQLRELRALQTHYGSVQLRSTFPRASRRIGVPPSKRNREGSSPSWRTRRVRLLARSRGSQPRRARSILARGAMYVSAGGSGGLATNEARGGSTPSRDTKPLPTDLAAMLRTSHDAVRLSARAPAFWDRLKVGRELLELAIVVRVHGPELRRASTAGDVRGFTVHVCRVRSPGSVRIAPRRGYVAGPDKSVHQGSTPWRCTLES